MEKLIFLFFSLIFFSFFFFAGRSGAEFISQTQIIMTTYVTIIADASPREIQKAFEEIKRVTSLMNDYDPWSEVGTLNRKRCF